MFRRSFRLNKVILHRSVKDQCTAYRLSFEVVYFGSRFENCVFEKTFHFVCIRPSKMFSNQWNVVIMVDLGDVPFGDQKDVVCTTFNINDLKAVTYRTHVQQFTGNMF